MKKLNNFQASKFNQWLKVGKSLEFILFPDKCDLSFKYPKFRLATWFLYQYNSKSIPIAFVFRNSMLEDDICFRLKRANIIFVLIKEDSVIKNNEFKYISLFEELRNSLEQMLYVMASKNPDIYYLQQKFSNFIKLLLLPKNTYLLNTFTNESDLAHFLSKEVLCLQHSTKKFYLVPFFCNLLRYLVTCKDRSQLNEDSIDIDFNTIERIFVSKIERSDYESMDSHWFEILEMSLLRDSKLIEEAKNWSNDTTVSTDIFDRVEAYKHFIDVPLYLSLRFLPLKGIVQSSAKHRWDREVFEQALKYWEEGLHSNVPQTLTEDGMLSSPLGWFFDEGFIPAKQLRMIKSQLLEKPLYYDTGTIY